MLHVLEMVLQKFCLNLIHFRKFCDISKVLLSLSHLPSSYHSLLKLPAHFQGTDDVWLAMSLPANSPVAGSIRSCPDTNHDVFELKSHCEYGPIAAGACSVLISLFAMLFFSADGNIFLS